MKKVVLLFAVALAFASCSNCNNDQKNDGNAVDSLAATTDSVVTAIDSTVATAVDSLSAATDTVVATIENAVEAGKEVVEAAK